MRLTLPLNMTLLAAMLAVAAAGAARASEALRPADTGALRAMRQVVDRYRDVTWTYERAARRGMTPTSFSYRRTTDAAYLQWTVTMWQRHAFDARLAALAALRQRLGLQLPQGPALHASLYRRVSYERGLALRLHQVYPGTAVRALEAAVPHSGQAQLLYWQQRAAAAAYDVSRHATRLALIGPRWLTNAFLCIHRYEGGWTDNTGNGYFGGLQMDYGFMQRYGGDFLRRWGTADRWPAWAQLEVAVHAYQAGRGFFPWPNTARACGLM